MDNNEFNLIWKALSDPTRRSILQFLNESSRTTTEIVDHFPELTRFNVMKHLEVLRSNGFVDTREDGRKRINSLNSEPINFIYENWLKEFRGIGVEESINDPKGERISRVRNKTDFGWTHYD